MRRALVGYAILIAAVAVISVAILIITGLLAMWGVWALIAWWMFGGRCARRRNRALRQGQWPVHGVGHQAERRAGDQEGVGIAERIAPSQRRDHGEIGHRPDRHDVGQEVAEPARIHAQGVLRGGH